ncbi:MAG: hypothetical protein AAF682_26345 [Planctomycetota bacterium]
MVFRKLGSVLRGQATPFQLFSACVLGAMLGFAPSFSQGPALLIGVIALLLLVNANLGLALLIAGAAKVLAVAAAPLSFRLGQLLLDGPGRETAREVVNAPVLAWCGLEYYAVAGGQVIALALGGIVGLFLARTVGAFRRRMLAAQDAPGLLSALAAKPAARLGLWLFFGGKGRSTWEQKLSRRVGNPVRVPGVALLLVLGGGAYAVQSQLAGTLARGALEVALERANGATADVGGLDLDLFGGRLGATDVALADPNELSLDLFRAAQLEADVDQVDLARRRVHLARVVVRDVRSGAPRETPGERVESPAEEESEPEAEAEKPWDPRDLSLEDVLQEYELWRDRLAQARGWLDKLSGLRGGAEGDERDAPPEGRDEDPADEPRDGESWSERIARQARERGWFSVRAERLIDEAPSFRLSELVVDGIATDFLPGRVFDLRATELSSHPALLDQPPRVELVSRDGDVRFAVDLAPASRAGGDGALSFSWRGLDVDDVLARLRLPGPAPLVGGTLDLELDGTWDDGRIGWVDLPLRATFRDTELRLPGIEPTRVDGLTLPIALSGSIDAPRIRFEHSTFLEAVAEAGKKELVQRLRDTAEEKLGELVERAGVELPSSVLDSVPVDLQEKLGGHLPDQAKSVLGGLLGGDR